MQVSDEADIDWKKLEGLLGNHWDAHSLRKRWIKLRLGVEDFDKMTHQRTYSVSCLLGVLLTTFVTEIVDALRVTRVVSSMGSQEHSVSSPWRYDTVLN